MLYIGSDGATRAKELYEGTNRVLTGITSTMVTSALGYTPANSSNYLPLSGGTISGNLILRTSTSNLVFIPWGSSNYIESMNDGGTENVPLWLTGKSGEQGSDLHLNFSNIYATGSDYTVYHSGNSNLSSVNWTVSKLTAWDSIHLATGSNPIGNPYVYLHGTSAIGILQAYLNTVNLYYGEGQQGNGIRIDSSNNIGVGCVPSYKLDVNGTLNATRILVNSATYGSDSLTVGGCIRITGGSGSSHAAGLRRIYFGDSTNCCLGEGGDGGDTDWMYIRGYHKILFECNNGSTTIDINGYPNSPGFIKSGSSDSYVLLGGGGHKAESSLSVSYANSAGSASSATQSYLLLTNDTAQSADACYDATQGLHFYRFDGTGNTIGGGDGWIIQWSWQQGSVGGQIYVDDNPSGIIGIRGCSGSSGTTPTGFTSWWRIYTDAYHPEAVNADTVDGYHASSLWRSDGGTWSPSANITLNATGNGQEWSFDIYRNGYTGCYWHVWDSSLGSMLQVTPDDGKVRAPYGFVGNLEGNATYATSAGSSTSASSAILFKSTDLRSSSPASIASPMEGRLVFHDNAIGGDSTWYDTVVLRSYMDSSGGYDNALFFGKNSTSVYHTHFPFGSTDTWGTVYKFYDEGNCNNGSTPWACSALTVSDNATITGYINLNNHGYLMSGRSTSFNYSYSLSLGDSSNSMGMFSGPGGEEGAIIVSPDTCVIYNSFDQGYGFAVFDKDRGGDLTTDTSRVFSINQSNYYVWSLGGFQKSGSSDSYVLLGGGGHKAVSDFATSDHTHSTLANSEIDTIMV